MNLEMLKRIFAEAGCLKIYVKRLSPNDNSKNQVYLGGSFDVLNILPIGEIINEPAGDWNKERFKATLNFSWIGDDGNIYPAPKSQLILYPKYPEVRFSGFLVKCQKPPSDLMTVRLANRLLFLGANNEGKILGYVTDPDSPIASEFHKLNLPISFGVFSVIEMPIVINSRGQLLKELNRINQQGWIKSKRLGKKGEVLACEAPNCGGYTLEAELGITPNGYSEPDYLGWEIKQFGVTDFSKIDTAIVTLMTPEPTNGYYVEKGVEAFIKKYGYKDLKGREDRMNFGGVHKYQSRQSRTNLTLDLIGFEISSGRIRNTDGRIALLDQDGNDAASWSFASLLKHWNRKHNNACYVPSLSDKDGERKYHYGDRVMLGTTTDFSLFLAEMALGHIYYDPGIKLENISTAPKSKRRSQFRIKSQNLPNLYRTNELVQLR